MIAAKKDGFFFQSFDCLLLAKIYVDYWLKSILGDSEFHQFKYIYAKKLKGREGRSKRE